MAGGPWGPILAGILLSVPASVWGAAADPLPGPGPREAALEAQIQDLTRRVQALEERLRDLADGEDGATTGIVQVPPGQAAQPDTFANPLGFPHFAPGAAKVEHGLGRQQVSVTLGVLAPDGRVGFHVPTAETFAILPTPPDGTFTIYNYTTVPLTIRWWAIRRPSR